MLTERLDLFIKAIIQFVIITDKRKEIIMNETKFLEFIDVNFTYPPVEEYDENGEVILQESIKK